MAVAGRARPGELDPIVIDDPGHEARAHGRRGDEQRLEAARRDQPAELRSPHRDGSAGIRADQAVVAAATAAARSAWTGNSPSIPLRSRTRSIEGGRPARLRPA